jgi:DNA polymerase-1
VNTVFGVASMLIQILKSEEPTHILFCFDADEDTFRHTEYAEYKAGRSATPDDFYPQVPRTLSYIDSFGFKSVSGRNLEADDYACAYARAAEKAGMKVTIVSGDKDLLQLVTDKVRVAIPHKGYQAQEYMGPGEVRLKLGVTPEQVPSYKGLVGDNSDNLKGVNGIGPKAAEALIQQYGSIENIYAHLADIKPSWRAKLEADREQAFFCERMATLVSNYELPTPLEDLELGKIDLTPVRDMCKEFEFSLVLRRLESLAASAYGAKHFLNGSSLNGADMSPKESPKKTESEQLSLI